MLPMVFCSIGIILTCLAIFQVRRERADIYIRMCKIEKMLMREDFYK
jgi:hypothetical protein